MVLVPALHLVGLACVMLAVYWSRNTWGNHPLARRLQKYHPQGWVIPLSSTSLRYARAPKYTSQGPVILRGFVGRHVDAYRHHWSSCCY